MSSPLDPLGPVSLAEWEYAYAYRDHLSLGDPEPDASGFDPARIAVIKRRVRERWENHLRRIRGVPPKSV